MRLSNPVRLLLSASIATLMVAVPGTAFADNGLDIQAASGPLTAATSAQIGTEIWVDPGIYIHGGTIGDGAVIVHVIAPGGTTIAPSAGGVGACAFIRPGIELRCPWPAWLVGSPIPPYPFYEWPVPLIINSANITPGRFWVECALDSHTGDKSAPILFIMNGITPTVPPATTPAKRRPVAGAGHTQTPPAITPSPTVPSADPAETTPTSTVLAAAVPNTPPPVTMPGAGSSSSGPLLAGASGAVLLAAVATAYGMRRRFKRSAHAAGQSANGDGTGGESALT
jgi:hypothetical protein